MEINLNKQDVVDFLLYCKERAEERKRCLKKRLDFAFGEFHAYECLIESIEKLGDPGSEQQCKDCALSFFDLVNSLAQSESLNDYFFNGEVNVAIYVMNFLEMENAEKEKNPVWELVLCNRFLQMKKELSSNKENCK